MTRHIGIDLGTTTSCAAVCEAGQARIIATPIGDRTLPSVIGFNMAGHVLTGTVAKRYAITHPERTLFGIKRLIGRAFGDAQVETLRSTLPYPVTRAPNGDAWPMLGNDPLAPAEISAHILRQLRKTAELDLDGSVSKAVVTVPAHFDDAQRKATRDALQIAEIESLGLINEPTAAAIAYGAHRSVKQGVMAVFDLGGGTFDVSILRLDNGTFEVIATAGDGSLGGEEIDRRMVQVLADGFRHDNGIDLREDPIALQRLREAAEHAKRELSTVSTSDLKLPYVATRDKKPLHLVKSLTRDWLEARAQPVLDRLAKPCQRALTDAGLHPRQIDQVILVGGMTRMPAVAARAAEIFEREPAKGIHPDEAVGLGAAYVAAARCNELTDVVLKDVTSHSLGLGVGDNTMSIVLPRNTAIPTKVKRLYKTTEDRQDHIEIEVFQGESPVADQNRMLGCFSFGGLPRAPAGEVRVEITFSIDEDGILTVGAKELMRGRGTSLEIEVRSGLSTQDVEALSMKHRAR